MSRRRTLKRYETLYRDPTTLFQGVEVTLFPNGANEIWCKTSDGLGFRVTVGNGPAGLGVCIRSFISTPGITRADGDTFLEQELVQYRQDARSQAYSRRQPHA